MGLTKANMTASFIQDIQNKNSAIKREMLHICIKQGKASIAEFSHKLGISIPTATKLIQELMAENFLLPHGKIGTKGGRRPSIYGINPSSGYFLGVNLSRQHLHIAVCDFKGQIIHNIEDIPFVLVDTQESFSTLCKLIKDYVSKTKVPWPKVMGAGISLSGRVNPEKGYSLSYFVKSEIPLNELFQKELNIPVTIENDSRAMAYGEYMTLGDKADPNMLFINMGWGLGMGLVNNGNLYYGKSGFSGEVGHFPILDNNIMCRCGKIGCLETGVSGKALSVMLAKKLDQGRKSSLAQIYKEKKTISFDDIMNAIAHEDTLTIECIEEMGNILGRVMAGLINIFNPGLVLIGGRLSAAGDYLMLPIKSAAHKYSMTKVLNDTKFTMSTLGRKAATIGDCLLSRDKLLGIM